MQSTQNEKMPAKSNKIIIGFLEYGGSREEKANAEVESALENSRYGRPDALVIKASFMGRNNILSQKIGNYTKMTLI